MRFMSARTLIGVAAGIAAIGIGGCAPLRSHQGYVIDADLVNSVQPGVDNRQSVLDTLGTPTFTSQFGQGQWFYLARDSRNFSYNKPKAVEADRAAHQLRSARHRDPDRSHRNRSGRLDRPVEEDHADAGPQAQLLRGSVRQYRHGRRAGHVRAGARAAATRPDAGWRNALPGGGIAMSRNGADRIARACRGYRSGSGRCALDRPRL